MCAVFILLATPSKLIGLSSVVPLDRLPADKGFPELASTLPCASRPYPSNVHPRPSEETAAQHEGAAGERAPRRSGRHRTPSRRLADAVADAAGGQHGALIAPKRAADGQPPSADEGRPKKSRRLTAQLHPSIPEGSTPATLGYSPSVINSVIKNLDGPFIPRSRFMLRGMNGAHLSYS